MVVIMAQRDDLMCRFGPLLLEAFGRILFDELNRIRSHMGIPLLTWEQFFAEINNHLSTLEPYEWMELS